MFVFPSSIHTVSIQGETKRAEDGQWLERVLIAEELTVRTTGHQKRQMRGEKKEAEQD